MYIGKNAKFNSNYGTGNASAISFLNNPSISATIDSSSIFSNNILKNQYNDQYKGTITNYGTFTLLDTTFEDNVTNSGSGGIANTSSTAVLNIIALNGNSTFTGNKAGATITEDDEGKPVIEAGTGTLNALHNMGTVNLNAATGKNVTFNDAITGFGNSAVININNTYDYITQSLDNEGNVVTKTDNHAPTVGVIIFNNSVSGNTVNVHNGELQNNGELNGALNVLANGTVTSSASNLKGVVANGGTINLSGGTTQNTYSGYTSGETTTNGTINVNGNVTVANAITENTMVFGDNTTTTVTSAGSLTLVGTESKGGAVDLRNNTAASATTEFDVFNLGSSIKLDSDLALSIDVNLVNNGIDTITSTNDATITGDNHILVKEIKVLADAIAGDETLSIAFATGAIKDYVLLDISNVRGADVTKSYIVSYVIDGENGNINFKYGNLYTAVHTAASQRSYALGADEPVLAEGIDSYGTMEGGTLTIAGGSHAILGGGKGGIGIGNGQTLTINNINSMSGFSTALDNSGTLNLNNVVFNGNIVAVNNTANMYLTGTNIFNDDITGTGTTTVSSGETTFNDTVTQGALNINSGTVNTSASNLNITNVITNNAIII